MQFAMNRRGTSSSRQARLRTSTRAWSAPPKGAWPEPSDVDLIRLRGQVWLGRSSSFNILNDSPPGRVSDGGPEHEAGRSTWRQATPTSAITAPCPAVDGDHRL